MLAVIAHITRRTCAFVVAQANSTVETPATTHSCASTLTGPHPSLQAGQYARSIGHLACTAIIKLTYCILALTYFIISFIYTVNNHGDLVHPSVTLQ